MLYDVFPIILNFIILEYLKYMYSYQYFYVGTIKYLLYSVQNVVH